MRALLALLLTLCVVGCGQKPDAMDSHGSPIHLSQYQPKRVLINYWAQWCHACMMEMPDLIKLQRLYSDQVMVVGVNFDGEGDDYLNKFSAQYQINFPMTSHLPLEKVKLTMDLSAVPTTIVLAPDGHAEHIVRQPKRLSQWIKLLGLAPRSE
jgi:thiol-disulfide isomerase/thioredoxin